ncbi:MAG TPA: FtsX-like permease family protein [Vicinamibacterales bacterium]|nr:FtsX-like permease family protein [Vicinamibacterales bacterium]
MPGWLRRLRARIKYRRFDRDLAREIAVHRGLKAEEHRRRGLGADEAHAAAMRDLGNVTLMREDARGVWLAPWLQSVWQDLRYAAASYRRQPLFAIGALLVLSLGTGLLTVTFSLAHALFLRPWRVPDPASVALLRTTPATSQTMDYRGISVAEFRYLRDHARNMDVIYTRRSLTLDLFESDRVIGRAATIYVSDNYLTALRLPIRVGRGFTRAENDYRTPALVAVISDGLWRRVFNRDPAAVGRTIGVDRRQVTIVGVAAVDSFMDSAASGYDLALPLTASARAGTPDSFAVLDDPRNGSSVGSAAGRLVGTATMAAAATELSTLSRQFRSAAALPAVNIVTVGTAPVDRGGASGMWQAAQLLLLALLLVLALACANVGNMLLARGLSRQREMVVRLALGAGRGRLVRQLLTEASLLSIGAATLGLCAAAAAPVVLTRAFTLDEGFDRPAFYALTAPVLWLALAIAVVTTAICGLAPALRATRATVAAMDRQGPTAGGVRLRRLLLAAQIALATVLLTGAGLLTRATAHALTADPGFALDELELISFELPRAVNASNSARRAFFAGLDEGLRAGGVAAAFVSEAPLSERRVVMFARQQRDGEALAPLAQAVSPSFFEISGVGIVSGRVADPRASPPEIVVSRRVARELWPNDDPIGKTLLEGLSTEKLTPVVVVGIATDAAINSLSELAPIVYRPADYSAGYLLIRDISTATGERVRALATALEPGVVIRSRPLREQARSSLQRSVAGGWLAWAVGGLALVLATVGAIGVFAYAVEERRREIGIRLALGARPAQIVGLVLRSSQTTTIAGLALGLGLSLLLAPLLRRYLYGLSPFDLRSYGQIALILLGAAAVASWAPARRAVRIDPVTTLRVD